MASYTQFDFALIHWDVVELILWQTPKSVYFNFYIQCARVCVVICKLEEKDCCIIPLELLFVVTRTWHRTQTIFFNFLGYAALTVTFFRFYMKILSEKWVWLNHMFPYTRGLGPAETYFNRVKLKLWKKTTLS